MTDPLDVDPLVAAALLWNGTATLLNGHVIDGRTPFITVGGCAGP